MIKEKDKKVIIEYAKKYKADEVILFGSSLEKGSENRDIDIAVKGIKPENFFKFYAEIFKRLTKPVDIIDLSKKSIFNGLIEKKGLKIYPSMQNVTGYSHD